MRTLGFGILGLLWALAAVLYSAPIWLARFGSMSMWVDPPEQAWIVRLLLISLSLIPLLVLVLATWRFVHSARA
jgi:hypothetical protein